MSLHDEYARLTPYELAFRSREAAEELVAAVAEESTGRGADPGDLHAFLTMGAVDEFARRLEGSDSSEGALVRFGVLAFHGLHFTRAGCPLFLLGIHAARYLVDGAPDGAPAPLEPAGYLQLPQHLVWADAGDGVPESVDGVFWTVTSSGSLHTMLVTGVRPDRAGLGVVPLPEAPLVEAGSWLEIDARGDGTDFSSTIPGSELDGLYQLTTSGEVLKLLARFFAYAASVPDALEPGRSDAGSEGADVTLSRSAGSEERCNTEVRSTEAMPQPSSLPFTRVSLPS